MVVKKKVDIESERQLNSIGNMTDVFTDGFMSNFFSDGIFTDISTEKIHEYLSNPDNYINQLSNLSQYYYMTNAEVFQSYDLARILPTLNYKINVYDKSKNYEKNMQVCNKHLNRIKHKQLTRDIISQTISTGTLTGIWLGDKKKPYLYIFDRPDKAFPAYRYNGEWIIQVDLSWVSDMQELERQVFIKNMSPYLTQQQYDDYQKSKSEITRYVDLPQERSVCLRTHTTNRNQQFGVNWSTTGLFDIQHKKKLKDLEKAIANKIIKQVAVLTVGSKDNPEYSNLKLNKELKRKIHSNVKTLLEKSQSEGVAVITIPEFAELTFPQTANDKALDPAKFTSINNDINSAYGTSPAIVRGSDGNFASGKLNLEVIYKRIAVLLEDIESEVYRKLIDLILPSNICDDYSMVYDKEPPLSLKEKVDYLMQLHSQEGFSLKAVLDSLSNIEYTEYVNQTIYEQEVLKLQDKVKPYASAHTMNSDSKPTDNSVPDNENTNKTKTSDGNNNPKTV